MSLVYNIGRHWFVDDFPISMSSHNIFRCSFPSCPYSVKMNESFVNGRQTFEVDHVIFSQHCHAFEGKKKSETKDIIEYELRLIGNEKDVDHVLEENTKRGRSKPSKKARSGKTSF